MSNYNLLKNQAQKTFCNIKLFIISGLYIQIKKKTKIIKTKLYKMYKKNCWNIVHIYKVVQLFTHFIFKAFLFDSVDERNEALPWTHVSVKLTS